MAHNRVTDKLYVGQTVTSLARRRCGHLYSASRGKPFPICAAIREHGLRSFEFFEVGSAPTKDQLNDLELLWIVILGTNDPLIGYNVFCGTKGKSRGKLGPMSEDRKRRISTAMKGKPRQFSETHRVNVIAANLRRTGSVITAEHKAKCGAALRGKKLPPRTWEHLFRIEMAKAGVRFDARD